MDGHLEGCKTLRTIVYTIDLKNIRYFLYSIYRKKNIYIPNTKARAVCDLVTGWA
jgi:hypothetical protein